MFKILAFIKRKEGISFEDFKTYYEQNHVKMANKYGLIPPTLYKRNFMIKGDVVNRNDHDELSFDCITEMGFESREYYNAWIKVLLDGNSGEEMTKDEEAFIDRDRLRYCLVEEVEGAPQLKKVNRSISDSIRV